MDLVRRAPKGLLGASDLPSMEILVVLTATFRKHGVGGKFGVTSRNLSLMSALHDKFGMTPIGRSRLNLPKEEVPDKDNPYAEFDFFLSRGRQMRAKQQGHTEFEKENPN
jgi:hypothetical protein